MTNFIFVTDFGMLYKVSKKAWRRYLTAMAAGEGPSISDFGKRVGIITTETTELSEGRASELLSELN
jgi:hypothetical protein